MEEKRKLLCIFSHPGDETLAAGGTLARYAAEGVETYLILATRGERNWPRRLDPYPGPEEVGQIREAELRCAAAALGIHEVSFLGYNDGQVDQAEPQEIITRIALHLRRICPQVLVTFDPLGVYGHPDHIATAQFTMAAVVAAASPSLTGDGSLMPHTVSKLYFVAETQPMLEVMWSVLGSYNFAIDGIARRPVTWPDWSVSTVVDTHAYYDQYLRALTCYQTQIANLDEYATIPQRFDPSIWGQRAYYRAFSSVNGGRQRETDLFEGIA